MRDTFDGITIGDTITEQFLNNGTFNSEAIGKGYALNHRSDLTASEAKFSVDGDDSIVYEVVEKAKISDGAIVQIDYVHNKIHEGYMFDADKVFTNVLNTGASYLCIKATTKQVHLVIAVSVEGTCYLNSYIDTTYSDEGTIVTAFNRKIDDGSEATAIVHHSCTIDTLGTQRYAQLIPGGSRNFSQGSTGASRIETVIYPGHELLVEIVNASGSTIDHGIVFEWYEEN